MADEESILVAGIANVGRLTTKEPQGLGANAALSGSDDDLAAALVERRCVVGRSGAHRRHDAMRRNIRGAIAVRRASHALRIPDQTFGARLARDSTTATDEKPVSVVRIAAEERLPLAKASDGGVADALALLRGLASVLTGIGGIGGRSSINVALGNGFAVGSFVTSTQFLVPRKGLKRR